MPIAELIREMRRRFDADCFLEPPDPSTIKELQRMTGPLPADALALYADHNGSDSDPVNQRTGARLPGRLLPIEEAIENQQALASPLSEYPSAGRIAWLWYDDTSNYAGIYTDGPLKGWVVKMDHEEPTLAPAWRSVESFLAGMLRATYNPAIDSDDASTDIPGIRADVPVPADDPVHLAGDRRLAKTFLELYYDATDDDERRFNAFCSIRLTPAADTAQLARFLTDEDMWTPEEALHVMEMRRFDGMIGEVERIAREEGPNGDAAAMRLLASLRTPEAEQALQRLQQVLSGQKRAMLRQVMEQRDATLPRRW